MPTGLPPRRGQPCRAYAGNELLILAGCNFGRRRCFCDLHVLNVDDMSWRLEPIGSLGEPLSPRVLTATMVRGSIYVFGGCYLAQRC